MIAPAKVVDLELTRPLRALEGLEGYRSVHALLRMNGAPVGQIRVPVTGSRCTADRLFASLTRFHRQSVARELLYQALARPLPDRGLDLPALLESPDGSPGRDAGSSPLVTVAVCTRDRPEELERCLESLLRLDYPEIDLLVVDNAPRSEGTRQLVRFSFPDVRYVREARPGLNWARNRAIQEARGEILAFTDDDVVVDPHWITSYVRLFRETPEVMAATGLVLPFELKTEAQVHFEDFGAFGQGYSRRWGKVDGDAGDRTAARFGATGAFGTGANMAFRRSVFLDIGLFDPALDVGTATEGGGDLEIFFRVLKEGHMLVREPRAIVRHRHRPEYEELRRQLGTWGIGLHAYVLRSCEAYPDERPGFLRMNLRWLALRLPRRLLQNLWRRRFPQVLLLDEVRGVLVARLRYRRARLAAEEIEKKMGTISLPAPSAPLEKTASNLSPRRARRKAARVRREARLVWPIDLAEALPEAIEAGHVRRLEVDLRWRGRRLGSAEVEPAGRPVRSAELRDAIADALAPSVLQFLRDNSATESGTCIPALLRRS